MAQTGALVAISLEHDSVGATASTRNWQPENGTMAIDCGKSPAACAQALARLFLVLLVALALSDIAHAQGAVRSVHGDWQIRCDTPPGAQGEQCALMQSV